MLLLLFASGATTGDGDEGPYPDGIVKSAISRFVIAAAVWRRD